MKRLIRALLIVVTIGAFLVACIFGLLVREFTLTAGESNVAQQFVIQQGDTVAIISSNLEDAGLIRRALLFRLLTNLRGAGSEIQAGTYYFSPNMTMSQMIQEMRTAQFGNFESVRVTIPEGLRLEEIAAIVEATGIVSDGEFLQLASDATAYKADYDFLADVPDGASLEGFLFPDTYDFFTDASADEIIRTMLDTFGLRYADVEQSAATADRSTFEIVTMASIIQREASNTAEMPRIAAVFWNRLKPEFAGQQLGADPTVQYALGYSDAEQSWWRKDLTALDLAVNSPYNTRINPGLPPGPISAPGLAALQAAANPAAEDITYFVAECVPEGERPTHQFTNDYSEFLRFQEEYQTCSK